MNNKGFPLYHLDQKSCSTARVVFFVNNQFGQNRKQASTQPLLSLNMSSDTESGKDLKPTPPYSFP